MVILVLPLIWLAVMGLFCLGPVGWILIAVVLEVFDQATQAPAKRILAARAAQFPPLQTVPPSEEPSISIPTMLLILLLAILGAAAIGSLSY